MRRIGELAGLTGFPAKTLRYYEDIGLLSPVRRSESGYRLYDEGAVERLRFVRRSRGLGLRLDDIKRILEISDQGRAPCEHVIGVVDRQLEDISKQMAHLKALRRDLGGLRTRLVEALETGAVSPGGGCPCFEDTPAETHPQ
jgi:DNA-binding transcriptional MerR regulator